MSKKWLIVAISLLLFGAMIFSGVMFMLKWDFTKLSTTKYQTSTHEITEAFKGISVVANTANVVLVVSQDTSCTVVCHEQANVTHAVSVKDGALVIEEMDARKWYEHIGINSGRAKITVSLPQAEYAALSVKAATGDVEIPKELRFSDIDISITTGDVVSLASATNAVKIKTTTGSIHAEGEHAGSLSLSTTTGGITAKGFLCEGDVAISVGSGKLELTDISCHALACEGTTGDHALKNVVATQKLFIKATTGDVRFDACDAAEIVVQVSTGDITGTLLSEKIFLPKSTTGNIDVPKTTTGGRCEITTTTGDIHLEIQK